MIKIVPECNQLIFDRLKHIVLEQHLIVEHRLLHPHDHILRFDQPFDELNEGRQHRVIASLFNNEHGQRSLVPGETLASWILNLPGNKAKMFGISIDNT